MSNIYTVSKVKFFRARNGEGFNATLLCNGKPVAEVDDEGNGGCLRWLWLASVNDDYEQALEDRELFKLHVAASSTETFEPEDAFLHQLVEDFQLAKDITRWTKKGLAFVTGKELRTTKAGFNTDAHRAAITAKYPNAIFLNNLPLADAVKLVKEKTL